MFAFLVLLQATTAEPAPDIELTLRARARSVEIERKGEAKLQVTGRPGSRVEARVEPKAGGRTRLRNVTVDIHAQASVAEGAEIRAGAETGAPR